MPRASIKPTIPVFEQSKTISALDVMVRQISMWRHTAYNVFTLKCVRIMQTVGHADSQAAAHGAIANAS
jgi:hypothetical protein